MTAPASLRLADGRLAALAWGEASAPTWLALHGWLDNAASFARLAPPLAERLGIRIVALDFAGHGHSAPRPGEGDTAVWDYCHDALDALDALGLQRVTLLGHSMGAGVACLLAATFPERIASLTLIDGLGVPTTDAGQAPAQLRRGLRAHRRRPSRSPRYADEQSAVAARVSGGVTAIDAETARPLVRRNLAPEADGRLRLRTDPRLRRPSPVRLTPEQGLAMLEAIRCPVLCVEGESGILGDGERVGLARAAVSDLRRRVLPGGHHLHLEPARVAAVVEAIVDGQA